MFYEFNENSGQTAYDTSGLGPSPGVLGSSTATTAYDPIWSTVNIIFF